MAFFARPQTTPVKIASPSIQDEPSTEFRVTPRKDTTVRQCRNVMIYGYCKYENKGCLFSHPSSQAEQSSPTIPSATASPSPETRTSAISAEAVNAPVFVPKAALTAAAASASSPQLTEASAATPTPPPDTKPEEMQPTNGHGYAHLEHYHYPHDTGSQADLVHRMEQLNANYYDDSQYQYHPHADEFYPTQPVYDRQPLDYHLYSPAPASAFVISNLNSHFVPPSTELRQSLQKRSETVHGVAPIGINLPTELQGYHTLVPLDNYGPNLERRKLGNWFTSVYRAIRSSDNMPYTLRRVENYRLIHQNAFMAIDIWSRIQHPSIVPVVEAFTTRAFQDSSVVFVHSYYPDAQTLFDAHLKPKPVAPPTYTSRFSRQHPQANTPALIPERTISSYVVQIATAIKKVHSAGLAVRMIDPTKILLTSQNRIRINSCGIIEVLLHDAPQDMAILQQEDLTAFGRLLLILCCNNMMAFANQNYLKSLEFVHRNYGLEMKSLIVFLTTKAGPLRNIDQVLEMIRNKLVIETEDALLGVDRLESELLGELENARLVRLLCKLNFINERPEFSQEPRWSETGDRYIIKLFRDYVFHQVDPSGNAVLNMGFVLTCLNKLDAGTDERIMLVSRDQQSCLVVSYKEIKACISAAFEDLFRAPTG